MRERGFTALVARRRGLYIISLTSKQSGNFNLVGLEVAFSVRDPRNPVLGVIAGGCTSAVH